jgi:4'-phosphopantetheinyl transferase EntD
MFVQRRPHPFGVLVTVAFPDGGDRPPEGALHVEEMAYAAKLAPARRITWVAGRVALRAALAELGAASAGPILSTARGAPQLPAGFVGSITHKTALAAALAAPADEPLRTLGVDLEIAGRLRTDIASRILTPEEMEAFAPLSGDARDHETLRWFAAKEAIYKALDPWVSRFVAFREATVVRAPDGALTAALTLPPAEGAFRVELHDGSADDLLLIAARIAR